METAILQPAEVLLDLYGEDIRARAYVTSDALRGEQMLRPDFTVPVVRMHMEHGAEPACYTYAGEVFRRQEDDPDRPNEYYQAGFEVFDRANPEAADARVFALFKEVLAPLKLRAATGDIGILMAAVEGLQTTERRKAALRRHIWRPRRFRALIERFSGRAPVPESRARLLAASDPMAGAGPVIGLRSEAEIRQRIAVLREDAATPPVSAHEVALLEAILKVRETCAQRAGAAAQHRRGHARHQGCAAWNGWRGGSMRWRRAVSTSRRWSSKRAMAARRWNITTGSSSASTPRAAPTCPPWPPAGGMTRSPASWGGARKSRRWAG